MAFIGIVSDDKNVKIKDFYSDDWFNYDWVLNDLNKDFEIEGMARIGFTDDGYEVFIVTCDYVLSEVPHFHYRKKEKGKKMEFHTCIRFDKAEYYHHTNDEDVLNDTQKKNLIKFLNEKPLYFSEVYKTNWEDAKGTWNHQNDKEMRVDKNMPMPNYMELK